MIEISMRTRRILWRKVTAVHFAGIAVEDNQIIVASADELKSKCAGGGMFHDGIQRAERVGHQCPA
jgi:translation initiation factor 1 (eIF-1/SUI1)